LLPEAQDLRVIVYSVDTKRSNGFWLPIDQQRMLDWLEKERRSATPAQSDEARREFGELLRRRPTTGPSGRECRI
jgi:hypothetical protein